MSERINRPGREQDAAFDALLKDALTREQMPPGLADATMARIRQARAQAEGSRDGEVPSPQAPQAPQAAQVSQAMQAARQPRPQEQAPQSSPAARQPQTQKQTRPEATPSLPQPGARSRRPRRPRMMTRRGFVTLMAACLGTAALAAGGVVALASETAQVEVGDGASVSLGLNRLSRVVRATGSDETIQRRLDELGVVSLACADAVERIAADDALRGALLDGGPLVIVVSSENEAQQASVLGQCRRATQDAGTRATCRAADAETLEAARDAGMGVARYETYLQIAAIDPSVSVEQCRSMSMRQLRDLLAQKQAQAGQADAAGMEEPPGSTASARTDASAASDAKTSSPGTGGQGRGTGQGRGMGRGAGGGMGRGAGVQADGAAESGE